MEFAIEWTTIITISTIVLTGLGTAISIIGANIALISWLRADMKSFETEIRGWKEEIQKESKDFHGRLCIIEEKHNAKSKD
ncbi:MAG: hypothetical protein ACH349_01310 [Candidatus Rhabdochlamydia sp.]